MGLKIGVIHSRSLDNTKLNKYEAQLIGKKNLTEKDMEYIYSLPADKRKVILASRSVISSYGNRVIKGKSYTVYNGYDWVAFWEIRLKKDE